MAKMSAKDPISQILDENNTENIVLYDTEQKPIEFEQVAVIPLERTNKLYAILIPVTPMQGVNEGEGVLFELDEVKRDVEVVHDDSIIDEVLSIYQKLIEDGEEEKYLILQQKKQLGISCFFIVVYRLLVVPFVNCKHQSLSI